MGYSFCMKTLGVAVFYALIAALTLNAQDTAAPSSPFFPTRVGTYWIYEGTVSWFDAEKEDTATERVSWRMSVDKVLRREGVIAAVLTGFPQDLDWSSGSAEPKRWLFLEDSKHQVHYLNLGPDFDLSKYEKGNQNFDKFLVDDTLLFEWPMKKGAKYCDADGKKRDDLMYCWFVASVERKKLDTVKGMPTHDLDVYELKYMSNPDDTTMELVPGIGLLSYRYHHHGTVADTELRLVEFHAAEEGAGAPGTEP